MVCFRQARFLTSFMEAQTERHSRGTPILRQILASTIFETGASINTDHFFIYITGKNSMEERKGLRLISTSKRMSCILVTELECGGIALYNLAHNLRPMYDRHQHQQ